jgi:prepilin-type N-terminal cleavage/methylation domain-containing protein
MYKLIRNKGFTLAEILITLLIVGIISSLVIPAIIQDSQNAELKVAFKKASASISQAYKLAIYNNGGGFGPVSFFTQVSVDKYNAIKSNMHVIKECPYGSGTLGKCWASKGVGLPEHTATNCSMFSNDGAQNSNYAFVTNDGMYWMLYSYGLSSAGGLIAVDVNGEKGPNDWGKDAFIFRIEDNYVTPNAYSYCNNLKTRDGNNIDADFSKFISK